jgi:predicted transposase YbfD/YdcC
LATIDGVKFVNQIPYWLDSLHVSQLKRLNFRAGIPDESTFRRLLRSVDSEHLGESVDTWLKGTKLEGKTIALDGKRLCGAHVSDSKPPEILNIVEHGSGEVLGQKLISGTGQEREAVVKWISKTSLEGCLLTGDALHTSKALAEMIVTEKKADYLMVIKANNKCLFEDLKDLKMNERRGTPHASTFEKNHGREESREIWTSTNIGQKGKVSKYFPGAQQIATVVRTQKDLKSEKTTYEIAYLVSSRTRLEMSPEQMLAANRGHWTVESKNHYIKDVTMGEDKSRCRAGNLAHNLATIRNVALKILRKVQIHLCTGKGRQTIPAALKKIKDLGGVCKILNM